MDVDTTGLSDDEDWRRSGPTREQRRGDIVTGAVLTVAAALSFELLRSVGMAGDDPPGRWEQTAWAVAVSAPLVVRRSHPLIVVVVVATAFIGLQARGIYEGAATNVALFLAIYSAGAWVQERRLAVVVRGLVVVAMASWFGISLSTVAWHEFEEAATEQVGLLPPTTAQLVFSALVNVAFFTAAWRFGDRAWSSARDRAELQRVNARLAVEREENARRAVVQERLHIARELHDVVAHHVSVMGVQAGAARHVMDRRPDAAREALSAVEQSSREAVEEMRTLLGVLRGGEDTLSPPPGAADLPSLVARIGRPGLDAVFTEVGDPRQLPAGLSVSLYRIAQEAVTNTVKHARARRLDVRLRWLDGAVEVEVVDDGLGGGSGAGTGMGVTGMRERVLLHGGTLEAGPREVGGFRVRARLPLADRAVPT